MKTTALSPVDTLFVNGGYPIEFLFFYPGGLPERAIRSSLRRIAGVFWPAFGAYGEGALRSVPFREEELFDEVRIEEDFPAHLAERPDPAGLHPLMLPSLERLFFLRLIHFRDGTALVPKQSHLAGDGYSYFYLLSVLAAVTRGGGGFLRSLPPLLGFRPQHRRADLLWTSLTDDRLPPLPATEVDRIVVASIPRAEVMTVVRAAGREGAARISTNDVLTARALRHILDERADAFGEKVGLTIPIDVRRHVKAFGRRFFGNAIQLHRTDFDQAALHDLSVTELAARIRSTMPEITTESYRSYLEGLDASARAGDLSTLRPYDPETGCLVTNLSRLPLAQLDFGTGAPVHVVPLTVGRHSTLILSRGEDFILRLAY
jgi:hypothetical protein